MLNADTSLSCICLMKEYSIYTVLHTHDDIKESMCIFSAQIEIFYDIRENIFSAQMDNFFVNIKCMWTLPSPQYVQLLQLYMHICKW